MPNRGVLNRDAVPSRLSRRSMAAAAAHRSTLHATFVSIFNTSPGEDSVTLQFGPRSNPRKFRVSKVPCTDSRRAPPEPSHNGSRTAGRR